MSHIAVVGSTMMDLTSYAERVPEAGETLVGDDFSTGFGGKGANQAVMASLLGAHVTMIACVGEDGYGQMTLANLGDKGIDTSTVRVVERPTGVASIWVEHDGTNRIIIVPGANEELTAVQAQEAIAAASHVDVVLGQLETPQEATTAGFLAARRQGGITILNPAPAGHLHEDLLAVTDWLVPNEVEFAALTGGNAMDDESLLSFAIETNTRLLVSLGGDGVAYVGGQDQVVRLPAPTVTALDTTGAGDAFVGAFAFGLASGASERTAIELGMRCASDSVTRPGTQASFPDGPTCRDIFRDVAKEATTSS